MLLGTTGELLFVGSIPYVWVSERTDTQKYFTFKGSLFPQGKEIGHLQKFTVLGIFHMVIS